MEEYILGSEHTVGILVRNSKAKVISISDKVNYQDSISVVQDLFFQAYRLVNFDKINELVDKAISALSFENGCAHLEILISDGKVFLLEIGARPGGGINFFPISYLSTGYIILKLQNTFR